MLSKTYLPKTLIKWNSSAKKGRQFVSNTVIFGTPAVHSTSVENWLLTKAGAQLFSSSQCFYGDLIFGSFKVLYFSISMACFSKTFGILLPPKESHNPIVFFDHFYIFSVAWSPESTQASCWAVGSKRWPETKGHAVVIVRQPRQRLQVLSY